MRNSYRGNARATPYTIPHKGMYHHRKIEKLQLQNCSLFSPHTLGL